MEIDCINPVHPATDAQRALVFHALATPTVAPRPQHRLHAVLTRERRSPNSKEPAMFKLIGSVVVYGFALLGLATYLEKLHGE